MTKIKKLLVANRGEIALRIMKTARDMQITTVAIFSEADRNALHVRYADEAFCVGPPPSNQSYLRADEIIKICVENKIDAIHPGYGFLSENADFADQVTKNGIIFIGPSSSAILTMGDKLKAKEAVANFDVPLVPGTASAISDISEAKLKAEEIGYPILIKASAGGGGKGMRIVEKAEDLDEQMQRAVSEAQSAFGNGAVFIEKFVTSPRHIEIQVMGDEQGNIVYLFERECSIQRRHQKVIEEAPSSLLTEKERAAMGKAAVEVAKACNYVGAGTVEFIVDDQRNFYFLEMNTRLQVEHPVTEEITGIDLVKEQLSIAVGKPLSFSQNDLTIKGHAMEIRVYAEDPSNNFLPDVGDLTTYKPPSGPGVRVDDSYEEGMTIPIFYDPMIAKLITKGKDREEARLRMIRAINDYEITGFATTLQFCRFVMEHENFVTGDFDTKFVEKHFTPEKLVLKNDDETKELAAIMSLFGLQKQKNKHTTDNSVTTSSKWRNRINHHG